MDSELFYKMRGLLENEKIKLKGFVYVLFDKLLII